MQYNTYKALLKNQYELFDLQKQKTTKRNV